MQLLSHRRPSVDWEAKVGHQPTLGWFQTSHGAKSFSWMSPTVEALLTPRQVRRLPLHKMRESSRAAIAAGGYRHERDIVLLG